MEPQSMTARQAARAIEQGKLSSEELVGACLWRIAAREKAVRAWAQIDPDLALAEARKRDRSRGKKGPLHGVPVGIKDIIDTADMPTAYNSRIYPGHRPRRDAECVARLRALGAVILGKTKTSEFAYLTPADTANPHNPARTPGGSSSGSAAAVADGMVPVALGTQTGGSTIRPAAYCGAFGFKPSYRRIGTRGVKSLAASFDTIGLIARSVDDLILLDRVLAEVPGPAVKRPTQPLRIGYCETPYWNRAEPSMRQALRRAADRLAAAGAIVHPARLPEDYTVLNEGFFPVCSTEAAWSLGREYRESAKLLSPRLRRFIEQGQAMEPDEVQRVRAAMGRGMIEMDRLFDRFDLLLTPAAPGEPELGNELGDNVFNRSWTALHLPCVTIPGAVGPAGLPLGIQLIGRRGADARLLGAARWVADQLAPT